MATLDESLGFNLYRVAQLYRRELIRALVDYDLTPEQWQLLATLAEGGNSITQGEIATLALKDKHSVSRMLDKMERAGWIARHPHPDDARATSVRLGRRGAEVGAVGDLLTRHFAAIDGLLSRPERAHLLALLRTLRHRLERAS